MIDKLKYYYYSRFRYYIRGWILPFLVSFYLASNWNMVVPNPIIFALMILGIFKFIQGDVVEYLHSTKEIDSLLDELFNEATQFLYIISPYFNPGENRLKSIRDASKNGCEVVILVNRNALTDVRTIDDLKRLQEAGCEIFIHPHLHSKIYINETTAITGSVNLLKGSFENSLEMGVQTTNVGQHKDILDLVEDNYLDEDDIEEFDINNIAQGYCIRTKSPINYNKKYPIKYDEYKSSNDKSGKYCHKCGKDAETSVNNPLCEKCFK